MLTVSRHEYWAETKYGTIRADRSARDFSLVFLWLEAVITPLKIEPLVVTFIIVT